MSAGAAAITGACVATKDAIDYMLSKQLISSDPIQGLIAAISVGIYKGEPVLDLDYAEDSSAETDMNVIMTEEGKFIEIQGTAEGETFSETELQDLLSLAKAGIADIVRVQKMSLSQNP